MTGKIQRGQTPRSRKDRHQVNAILDPEEFDTVQRMAESLEMSKAEVVRQLVGQGIAALRAASAADSGQVNRGAAAIAAMQLAAVEAEVTKLHLDALGGHLDGVMRRSWRDAVLLASGGATALARWADEKAEAHGTTVAELMGRDARLGAS